MADPFDLDDIREPILVYGAGGHGKAVIELVQTIPTLRVAAVVDDRVEPGTQILGVPVMGGRDALLDLLDQGICKAANGVGGIGNVDARLRVFDTLTLAGFVCPALVHPTAVMEPSAILEEGVQVMPRAYVGTEVRVGYGSLINVGAIISHECVLGRCVNLSPGAVLAGRVTLENYVQVGMAATINLDLHVGERARIGNGATVRHAVPAGVVVRAGAIWQAD